MPKDDGSAISLMVLELLIIGIFQPFGLIGCSYDRKTAKPVVSTEPINPGMIGNHSAKFSHV